MRIFKLPSIALLLFASSARAEDPNTGELQQRLRALERIEAIDDSVKRPIELAHAAFARANDRAQRGDARGAERARSIAVAAVELAAARLDLLRERALRDAAEARRRESEQALKTAEAALARERARAEELRRAHTQP